MFWTRWSVAQPVSATCPKLRHLTLIHNGPGLAECSYTRCCEAIRYPHSLILGHQSFAQLKPHSDSRVNYSGISHVDVAINYGRFSLLPILEAWLNFTAGSFSAGRRAGRPTTLLAPVTSWAEAGAEPSRPQAENRQLTILG